MNKEQQILIDESITFPEILKNQKKYPVIDFFSRRPGGNYILYLVMMLYERKIECTEEVLIHYMPTNVCSKSTLSNIIKDSINENILTKVSSANDNRSKILRPGEEMTEQWRSWKILVREEIMGIQKKNIEN